MEEKQMKSYATPDSPFSVRSDKLRELRASLAYLRRINYPIGAIPKFSLVVDTNAILGEIRWLAGKRSSEDAKTGLMEILEAETVELYAPPALFEEVEEKIPLLAATQGLDADVMCRHWRDYKAKIRLAVPDEALVRQLLSGADPDDAPFVALEKTLGAHGVLSKDKHISMMGGNRISLDCVFRLRDYSRATAVELNIRVAGAAITVAGYAGLRACFGGIATLSKGVRNAPDWLKLALFLGALAAMAHPRSRAKLAETARRLLCGVEAATPAAIRLLAEATRTAHLNQAKAKEYLDGALTELARSGAHEAARPGIAPGKQER